MNYGGFVGPSYRLQSVSADCQRSVNLYPQIDESQTGKAQSILLSVPGLLQFCVLADGGPIRGAYVASNGRVFVVAGRTLYELFPDASTVQRGQLSPVGASGYTEPGQDTPSAKRFDIQLISFEVQPDPSTPQSVALEWNQGLDRFTVGQSVIFGDLTNLTFLNGAEGVVTLANSVEVQIALNNRPVAGYNYFGADTGYIALAQANPVNPVAVNTQVSMTDNGIVLAIVDGPFGYLLTFATNTYLQVTSENFHGGDAVEFISGYLVCNQPESQKFWWTDAYSTNIDGLNFAVAEGSPDNIVTLLADHQELWLFGTQSTEVWYPSGDTQVFSRLPGAFIPVGIAAKLSAQRLDNTVFWLGKDANGTAMVWKANGYTPTRVSTHAMEQAIQRYAMVGDATSYTYQQDGHSFYVLNFPSATKNAKTGQLSSATWVYDAATASWHERASLNLSGSAGDADGLARYRANVHIYAFGKHLVGDYANSILYEMSPAFVDDNGTPLQRMRVAPFISSELKRVNHSELTLDMEVGQGSVTTPETDDPPMALLSWSDDGGYTWSNDRSVSIGKAGQFRKRVTFRRLGQSRQRAYRLKISDPVSVTLYAAYIEVSK